MNKFQGKEWIQVGRGGNIGCHATWSVLLLKTADKGIGAGYTSGPGGGSGTSGKESMYCMQPLEKTCAEMFGRSICGVRKSSYGCRRVFVSHKAFPTVMETRDVQPTEGVPALPREGADKFGTHALASLGFSGIANLLKVLS